MTRSAPDASRPIARVPAREPMSVFFDRLRTVASAPGPFLSCYLPVQTVADVTRSRHSVAAGDLSPDESVGLLRLLSASEERADGSEERTDEVATVVVIRAADGTSFIEHYPEPVREPVIERGAAPRLATVVEAEQRLRHHVLAVVSNEGLDLLTFPRHGEPTLHRVRPRPIPIASRIWWPRPSRPRGPDWFSLPATTT